MNRKLKFGFITAVFAIISSFGCAHVDVAKQKAYAPVRSDLGTIYFYRESMFQGSLANYNIWENESAPNKLGALKNGSYFFVQLPPGKRTVFVNGEVRSAVTLDLKAGRTYYIQCNINMGFWAGRPKLTQVTEDEAMSKIKSSELVMTVP